MPSGVKKRVSPKRNPIFKSRRTSFPSGLQFINKPRRIRGSDAANPILSIFRRHVRRKISLKRSVTLRSRADQGGHCPPRWSASIPSTFKERSSLNVINPDGQHVRRDCFLCHISVQERDDLAAGTGVFGLEKRGRCTGGDAGLEGLKSKNTGE